MDKLLKYKTFENIEPVTDFYEVILTSGDNVIIRCVESQHYNKTGVILNLSHKGIYGDCLIKLDYEKLNVIFYKTNLIKIDFIININSGEAFIVTSDEVRELFINNLIDLDNNYNYFYFKEEDISRVRKYFYKK